MAGSDATALSAVQREVSGSRAVRRLRRQGGVPGIVYGGGEDPVPFQVDSRKLRQALAHAGAVLDLKIGGEGATPVVLKELVRHPVSSATMHIDLLRVRLDVKIQATVVVELVGADDAPGVKEGGVLEQITREVTIEALPNDIPDAIEHDVSGLQMNDTVLLESLTPPGGVVLLDDPETVVATVLPPRLQLEDETEIESETEVVGEGEDAPEGESTGEDGGDSADSASE
jgi:large subunit ribosomal protein L25